MVNIAQEGLLALHCSCEEIGGGFAHAYVLETGYEVARVACEGVVEVHGDCVMYGLAVGLCGKGPIDIRGLVWLCQLCLDGEQLLSKKCSGKVVYIIQTEPTGVEDVGNGAS